MSTRFIHPSFLYKQCLLVISPCTHAVQMGVCIMVTAIDTINFFLNDYRLQKKLHRAFGKGSSKGVHFGQKSDSKISSPRQLSQAVFWCLVETHMYNSCVTDPDNTSTTLAPPSVPAKVNELLNPNNQISLFSHKKVFSTFFRINLTRSFYLLSGIEQLSFSLVYHLR